MNSSVMTRAALVGVATVMLSQCGGPISPPAVRPFAEGDNWMLVEDMHYQVLNTELLITVPAGFVTDFASIPPALRSAIAPVGRHGKAAVVHDFLYWEQRCSRAEADLIFRLAMWESDVDPVTSKQIYDAVRVGGQAAWAANATDRGARVPRIVPPDRRRLPANSTWLDYRLELMGSGVRSEPAEAGRPAYCDAANLQVQ